MSPSQTLDITEDLTEQQLAEEAFCNEDIIVYWDDHGVRKHGLIVGYEGPDPGDYPGVFEIDEVELINGQWRELDSTLRLSRNGFVVLGPMERHSSTSIIAKYLDALNVLLAVNAKKVPAFRVRLDVDLEGNIRKYRLLVRSVFDHLTHDDIAQVLQIAERYELQVRHENVGLMLEEQGS